MKEQFLVIFLVTALIGCCARPLPAGFSPEEEARELNTSGMMWCEHGQRFDCLGIIEAQTVIVCRVGKLPSEFIAIGRKDIASINRPLQPEASYEVVCK